MREKSNFNRIALSSNANAPIHTKVLKINLKKYRRIIPITDGCRTYLFVRVKATQQK
ncbi:hypothetical protein OCF56_18820 [Bacillus mycoides]|nr:hypothetical protein [Bacillus mycoides]